MIDLLDRHMNILEVVDKKGRIVIFTKERWTHITEPASPHAYMTTYLEEIRETLEKPDKIVKSVYDETKVNYYRYYKSRKEFLKVVVKYINDKGEIITAYLVRNITL